MNRLTTSYEALRPFMEEPVGQKRAKELVDVVLMGSLVRPQDFAEVVEDPEANEHSALQNLVWSMLGNQQGPITRRDKWERQHGTTSPWNPARTTLYKFERGTPLNPPNSSGSTKSYKPER